MKYIAPVILAVAAMLAAVTIAIINENHYLKGYGWAIPYLFALIAVLLVLAIVIAFINSRRDREKKNDSPPPPTPPFEVHQENKPQPLSLQQRTLALARRLRQFIQKHGARPTLVKADGESNADYLKRLIPKTQAWDDTVSGDYWGFLFSEIQQIRGELAQKGLDDSRINDNYRIGRPKEENLRAIVEGLRFLASKLDV
jgi:hypothetical protein